LGAFSGNAFTLDTAFGLPRPAGPVKRLERGRSGRQGVIRDQGLRPPGAALGGEDRQAARSGSQESGHGRRIPRNITSSAMAPISTAPIRKRRTAFIPTSSNRRPPEMSEWPDGMAGKMLVMTITIMSAARFAPIM